MNARQNTLGYILIPIISILLYSHNLMGDKLNIQNSSTFPIQVQVAYHGEALGPMGCLANCPEVFHVNANQSPSFNLGSKTISNIEIFNQSMSKSFGRINVSGKNDYIISFDDKINPPLRLK